MMFGVRSLWFCCVCLVVVVCEFPVYYDGCLGLGNSVVVHHSYPLGVFWFGRYLRWMV